MAQGAEGVQHGDGTWLGSRWQGSHSPGSASLCPQQSPPRQPAAAPSSDACVAAPRGPSWSDYVLVIPASHSPALASSCSCSCRPCDFSVSCLPFQVSHPWSVILYVNFSLLKRLGELLSPDGTLMDILLLNFKDSFPLLHPFPSLVLLCFLWSRVS